MVADTMPNSKPVPPQAMALMLATCTELYRHEVGAEEDVYRTLPFFGTALGIVIGALAYAAGRLPKWSGLTTHLGMFIFCTATALLALAVAEAGCVLVYLSRAIAQRGYGRIGPETALRTRLNELRSYYDGQGTTGGKRDADLLNDMQMVLLESYTSITPVNRALNQRRYRFRALASSHLIRSLIWALGATTVIFMTDKLGYLPTVVP